MLNVSGDKLSPSVALKVKMDVPIVRFSAISSVFGELINIGVSSLTFKTWLTPVWLGSNDTDVLELSNSEQLSLPLVVV